MVTKGLLGFTSELCLFFDKDCFQEAGAIRSLSVRKFVERCCLLLLFPAMLSEIVGASISVSHYLILMHAEKKCRQWPEQETEPLLTATQMKTHLDDKASNDSQWGFVHSCGLQQAKPTQNRSSTLALEKWWYRYKAGPRVPDARGCMSNHTVLFATIASATDTASSALLLLLSAVKKNGGE